MTKRTLYFLAVAAVLGFAVPSQGHAQALVYVSGGGAFPTSDFGDFADTGWMLAGGVLFDVGAPGLGVGVDGFYGQNNHTGIDGEKTTPYGVMGIVDYSFRTGSEVTPYLFGGAGLLVHRFSSDTFGSDSDSQFGYQFGGGLAYGVSERVQIYGEGRFIGSEDTKFFGALAGLAFGVGN